MTAITRFVGRGALVTLVCLGMSMPALAQGVGAIGGTVTDDSGGVLPGATVTLSSEGVIGGSQVVVAGARGDYQFPRLVPGEYTVQAELQGFRTIIQEGVLVNADRTSRADLILAVGALEESLTVVGEVPLLDTTTALNQTVMTREVLDSVPTGTDIWSIARLAPGVQMSKYDVGGREMLGQSDAFVHGSLDEENTYLIDGMDIGAYSSATGSSLNFYPDSHAMQEVNYQNGQTPADRAVGGAVVNMITRTGTNVFHGSGQYFGKINQFDNATEGSELYTQLLAGVPAGARAANPNIRVGGDIQRMFETAWSIGGPIIRDRLWFQGAFKYGVVDTFRVGSYNADGTQLLSDNELINTMIKGSYALNQNNQLHYSHLWVHKGRYHRAGGPTTTAFFDIRASDYNPSRNNVHIGRWTSVLSRQAVLVVAASTVHGQTNAQPQPEVQIGDIARFDAGTNTYTVAADIYDTNAGHRSNVNTSLNFLTGNHDFKFGYQYFDTSREGGGYSMSHFPSGFLAVYRNGVPDSVDVFNTPTEYRAVNRDQALYIQDNWRPTPKLTLNMGLRFEKAYGELESPLCQAKTIFIDAQCFDDIKGAPDWNSILPRFAVIYDLFGDGRTALKFSANQYRIPQGNSIAQRINPIDEAEDTRAWTACAPGQTSGCDFNGDLIPQLDELGPSQGFALGTNNRYADDVRWPKVNEISVEIERELPGQIVVTGGYYYRGHRDLLGVRNVAVPTESYTPIDVIEVNSGRQVTVWNKAPELRRAADNVWANYDGLEASFHGVDFSARKRMSNNWMMMASLSLSGTEGDIHNGADLNDPNRQFRRGVKPIDRPVFFKWTSAFLLPSDISIGMNIQYFDGFPDRNTVRVDSSTIKLVQNRQTIIVEPAGTSRLDSIATMDLNFRVNLGFLEGATIEPRLDIFNLFNAAAVTRHTTQYGPSYGRAVEILGGRLIKAGLNLTF